MRGKNEAGHLQLRGRMDVGGDTLKSNTRTLSPYHKIQPYFECRAKTKKCVNTK